MRFPHDADDDDDDDDESGEDYWDDLADGLHMARAGGARRLAAASLFTTHPVRAISRKIRRQLDDEEHARTIG